MQQPVVQNYSQWPPVMSQPGIQPQNFAQPQYQSHMVAGQPLYRAVGPQPAVQPSLPQALPVQQQRPLTDEDRRIIPKRSIERLATAAGGSASSAGSEAEAALLELAEDWITKAIVFGCASARKRGAEQLAPSDVAPYFERTWAAAVRRTIAEASAPKEAPATSAQVPSAQVQLPPAFVTYHCASNYKP
ncbi:hypothetical protein COCSUDRAFT_60971 [Coccomyxa subellipsoidea C-169]|uniref:Uncharacterized protein n=1 Tax=Coccomyxa subellipsoidea (strain C-169) TaxID=574566 RepID=I0Z5Q2_COCSC|nr:hypothetical protein COCSUDRAFT_60971 [Coccomyxa subellipsoidea C-169]EIE25971.1 hypothetical protein COCSUDRAFT_60971 [Coccomyxa subellipsoidea C-169]|eukprot:XP_005650515.1 hypothetical protein COCSUDRAFT_60971 [Coccomyxa subellipsoidea C-169]